MGYGSHCVTSPRMCFSTEDYKEWMDERYYNYDDDDGEKILPKWFYLSYCEKYREFVDNI